MTNDNLTIAKAVAERGAALLDEHGPHNWHLLVTEPVGVCDTENCVLGQVFGGYFSDGACDFRSNHVDNSSSYYGYDGGYVEDDEIDGRYVDGDQLVNEAWDALIKERKGLQDGEPIFTLSQLRDLHASGKSLSTLLDEHTSKPFHLTERQRELIAAAVDGYYGAWSDDSKAIKAAVEYV